MAKRSRAGEPTPNSVVQAQGDQRLKRRRTSGDGNDAGKSTKSDLSEDSITALVTTQGSSVTRADKGGEKTALQSEPWSLSRAVAGHYSNLDPLFSPDEQYLLLSVATAIHVYSVATSRLFRTLQICPGSNIIGYKLSPMNSEHLLLLTSLGSVSEWNWNSGKQVANWETHHKTISADIIYGEAADPTPITLFSLRERKDGKKEITATCLGGQKTSTNIILETSTRINQLRVTEQGRTIIGYGGVDVCFGTANSGRMSESIQYTWREVKLPFNITCVDIKQSENSKRAKSRASDEKKSLEDLDIAFGAADGSILIYHDALGFVGLGDSREEEKNRAPRRLHWHRDQVMALRWSKDGNYIISGGNESVMVLWQLDTGRKQFLPHLSSPVCNIVISPSGNSYVVKLGDNRIMVLSARELQPSLIITGLQLCSRALRSSGQSSKAPLSSRAVTTILHPQNPDHLLIAVPASLQVLQEGPLLTTSPILQTYDIRSNSHISRQALARTNATTLNISPDGAQILTPDVKHLGVSHDGKWMATIDNWNPYPQDVESLGAQNPDVNAVLTDFEEIHLKFWKWNRTSDHWELVTRIEEPHYSDQGTVPVLDLASRAQSHEFATIGSDAVLRFWRPSLRQRSGLKSDDVEESPETWKCRNTLDLGGYLESCSSNLASASICFSQDGSVLAICMQSASANPGLALLVDVQNGEIKYDRTGVYSGDLQTTSFLGSRLIVATNRLVFIWDTVMDTVMTTDPLGASILDATEPCSLAVNARTQTFAVASRLTQKKMTSKKSRKIRPSVQVYDVQTASLLSQITLFKDPVALLSNLQSNDYVIVDSAANIQRLTCVSKAPQSVNADDMIRQTDSGLATLFGRQRVDGVSTSIATGSTYSRPLEGAGLASVFGDAPPFVLPPSRIVFRDLVKALSA